MNQAVILVAALLAAANAATILEIAKSLPQFSTLVTAAGQAGIAPLLNNPGSLTVFAPTNDAFGLLGNNTAGWILNAHNQQALLSTLYYHIAAGQWTSGSFAPPQLLPTLDLQGPKPEEVLINNAGSGLNVNNAKIVQADVQASNGYIHVIDHVLVPKNIFLPSNDIVETAIATPALSTLVKAVTTAGLVAALSKPNGPYVVFAPTDAAFAAVPSRVLTCLLNNKDALTQVLLLHVASGYVYAEQVAQGASLTTLNNKQLTFSVKGGTISIGYGAGLPLANVVIPNVDTANGVVHVIDRVLFDNSGPCA